MMTDAILAELPMEKVNEKILTSIGKDGKALRQLQAKARAKAVREAFLYLKKRNNKMALWQYWIFFFYFVMCKIELLCCVAITYSDQYTQWSQPIPTEANSKYRTPFQQHPHRWGWFFQVIVTSHVISGSVLLLTMVGTLYSAKGDKWHRIIGRLFLVGWVVHMFDGLFNASIVILNRGFNEELYPPKEDGFSMWLYIQFSFVANVTCDFLLAGITVTQFKVKAPKWVSRTMLLCASSTIIYCGMLLVIAVYVLANTSSMSPRAIEYAVVFLLDFPVYLFQAVKNYSWYSTSDPQYKLYGWPVEHQRNMMFTANFTLITAAANFTFKVAPWATITLFASQEVTWLLWIFLKERGMKKAVELAYNRKTREADNAKRSRNLLAKIEEARRRKAAEIEAAALEAKLGDDDGSDALALGAAGAADSGIVKSFEPRSDSTSPKDVHVAVETGAAPPPLVVTRSMADVGIAVAEPSPARSLASADDSQSEDEAAEV